MLTGVSKSLISKDSSESLKGILILLITLGHNSILVRNWENGEIVSSSFIYYWLYSFHVYAFFILPFLYTSKSYEKGNLKKYATKILYPYFWIFIICLFLYNIIEGSQFNGVSNLIYSFFIGNDVLLKDVIGFNFPWFLPIMFSILLLKDFYYSSPRYLKLIIIFISISLWMLSILSVIDIRTLTNYTPFSFLKALYFFLFCLISLFLIKKYDLQIKQKKIYRYLFTLIFVIISLLLYLDTNHKIIEISKLLQLLMPISFFIFIYSIIDYIPKSKWLIPFGKYSFQIYLYHVIIYNVLLQLVLNILKTPNKFIGIIVYLLTLVISLMLAIITTKYRIINNILYPKSFGFSKKINKL